MSDNCEFGFEDCEEGDYDTMCDDHKKIYGENKADMRNDID